MAFAIRTSFDAEKLVLNLNQLRARRTNETIDWTYDRPNEWMWMREAHPTKKRRRRRRTQFPSATSRSRSAYTLHININTAIPIIIIMKRTNYSKRNWTSRHKTTLFSARFVFVVFFFSLFVVRFVQYYYYYYYSLFAKWIARKSHTKWQTTATTTTATAAATMTTALAIVYFLIDENYLVVVVCARCVCQCVFVRAMVEPRVGYICYLNLGRTSTASLIYHFCLFIGSHVR